MRLGLPLLLALASLSPVASADESPALHVPIESYRLPNGLAVILHEDHRAPSVVVDLWFRVGSKDERAGRSGFAHLFEHLMFMGTRAVPNGRFDAIMEAAGGWNNASTSEDRTNYFESGPSNLLETFLWLEGDRLRTLGDDMTGEKLDLQRDVVKNERRQSYENRPYGQVELLLPEHLYPEGHPYHHPVIGSHQDLTAASVDDVKAFFREYYVPSNATLVVAGDFRPDEARRWIERYLGALPKAPEPAHAAPAPVALAHDERVVVEDDVELPRVVLAWHSPAALAPGDAECDLLAAALGAGKSSRLYRRLVQELRLAESVQVEQHGNRYGGELTIQATAQPGVTAAALEKALAESLAALAHAPPGEGEVARARTHLETRELLAIEKLFNLADELNAYAYYAGDAKALEGDLLGRYERATVAGVGAAIRDVLGRPHVTIVVEPRKGGAK